MVFLLMGRISVRLLLEIRNLYQNEVYMHLRSIINVFILAALFAGSSTHPMGYYHRLPVHHSSQAEELGKAVVAVGCIAAIGYGFYKLCDWLFSKTDIQVLQEAQQVNMNAEKSANMYVDFFESKWGDLLVMENAHKRHLMRTLDESLLYQFAIAHAFKTSVEYTILSTLNSSLQNARSAQSMVVDRLHKLRKKKDMSVMITQLELVAQSLQSTISRIEFVYEYLEQHRSYYALLINEYKLMKECEYELHAIKEFGQNAGMLRETLRIAVMRHANSHMTYPYMNYIQKMQKIIQELDRQINSLSCHYPERMNAARILLAHFNAIYNMLIIEDAYRQELRDYERAQLEKQRIEAEQAKAAAAQAAAHAAQVQAAAMQQQAWEMQKQNQLYAQQNQLQAEQNAILTAQVIVDAVNPRPTQQVHVYN